MPSLSQTISVIYIKEIPIYDKEEIRTSLLHLRHTRSFQVTGVPNLYSNKTSKLG